jgi:hypothetical protein
MSGILVESPHTLRIPPSATAKKALVEYAKQHGLRNEYLKKSMAGESRVLISTHAHAHEWQSLNHVRWLTHASSGELVVIVGGATNFARTDRAKQSDMAFPTRTLQHHLQPETSAPIKSADGQHSWLVQPRGFVPAQVASLSDGASLTGIFDASTPSSALPTLPDFGSFNFVQMDAPIVLPNPLAQVRVECARATQPMRVPHALRTRAGLFVGSLVLS